MAGRDATSQSGWWWNRPAGLSSWQDAGSTSVELMTLFLSRLLEPPLRLVVVSDIMLLFSLLFVGGGGFFSFFRGGWGVVGGRNQSHLSKLLVSRGVIQNQQEWN